MISYYTSTPNAPPVSDAQRAAAMQGFKNVPNYGYGQGFADNYSRLSGAGEYDRAAQMANADYLSRQQDVERQGVLAGLQMMADERKRQQDIGTQKIQTAGQVANILSGLYG